MNRAPDDERSIIAMAYTWATTIIVIAGEMVVPGLIGLWLGRLIASWAMILFAFVGFAAGMFVAMLHLIRLTKSKDIRKL